MANGYVVTNAHVAWPFQEVRVVFPDGTERLNVPVRGVDMVGDLTVIGPLDTDFDGLRLTGREDLAIGSDVYLIGYPAEGEEFPQPTITQGILSRLREWEPIQMTYLQTDAAIAGGQSGGVLVSEDGEVIGISGFLFSEAGFGLVASAADVLPRIQGLIIGEDIDGLGDRQIPLAGGKLEYEFTLDNQWDSISYVINEPLETTIELTVEGESDGGFALVDAMGNFLLDIDVGVTGIEKGSASLGLPGPHFFVPYQFGQDPEDFKATSNKKLARYTDVDDGSRLAVGQTNLATIDHPFDVDFFLLDLNEGETVNIVADSMNIDPTLTVHFRGATIQQAVQDDDSGGGIFNHNAKVTYRAPHQGEYYVIVANALSSGVGGYYLSVSQAPPGAIPATIAKGPAVVESPFGPMAVYQSAEHRFSIQYPAGWNEQAVVPGIATASFVSGEGQEFTFAEEDLIALGLGELSLEEYLEVIISVFELALPGFQLISENPAPSTGGLPAAILDYTALNGLIQARRLIFVDENNVGFNATYAATANYEDLLPLIDYLFGTFKLEDA